MTGSALASTVPGVDEEMPSSGLVASFPEMLIDEMVLRVRYVIPQIKDTAAYPFDALEADFQWLCDAFAIGERAKHAPETTQIVISFASEPLPFGETAPNVVQYFEAFRIEDDACIWEGI